jgi:hypothetical protein
MITSLLLVALLQLPLVKNPSGIIFTCSTDHDTVTGYEVDIVRTVDNVDVAIQTINIGKPAKDAVGDCTAMLNVQPIAFGIYVFKARAIAGTVKSSDSLPSDSWERAPGAPGKPRPGGER